MLLSSGSSERSMFTNSQYFTQTGSLDEWYCNICTPSRSGLVDCMTLRAAQHHERHSLEHARNVTETETRMWWNPSPNPEAWTRPLKHEHPLTIDELKMRDTRLHVDLVQDMVPFWIRGVEAAEKGEVLRLEVFLETLQTESNSWAADGAWVSNGMGACQDWGKSYDDEGQNGWGVCHEGDWNALPVPMKRSNNLPRKKRQVTADVKRRFRGAQAGSRPGLKAGGQESLGNGNAHDFVEDVARQQAADEERKRRMHSFFDMPTHEKVKKIEEFIRDLHRDDSAT